MFIPWNLNRNSWDGGIRGHFSGGVGDLKSLAAEGKKTKKKVALNYSSYKNGGKKSSYE